MCIRDSDRVVHHALIVELTGKSKRADDAQARDGRRTTGTETAEGVPPPIES